MMTFRVWFALTIALGASIPACIGEPSTISWDCPGPGPPWCPEDAGAGDAASAVDAGDGGSEDGGSNTKICQGQCVAIRPLGFSDPIIVYISTDGTPLPDKCPEPASTVQGTMYGDLSASPLACGCLCAKSTGTCTLPSTFTASNSTCGALDPLITSFDPPADWDGSCSDANAIPGGMQCNGAPCVESLTIGAMTVVEDGCKVEEPPSANFTPPTWAKAARLCEGYPIGGEEGCGTGAKCASAPPVPPEFRTCVWKEGDVQCEGEHFTEHHLLYAGYDDQRKCTPCGCSADVEGSVCSAVASVFTDALCVDPVVPGVQISSVKDGCFDLTLPGQALGSKQISNVKYHPGTCQPTGGETEGEILFVGTATLCCIPPNQ